MRSANANSARNGAWSRSSGTRSATTTFGHWQDRAGSRNVEAKLLRRWLERQGHGDGIITRALRELDKAASLGGSKTLYDANRETYERLRYGVKVQPAVGKQTVTVWLIGWENPANN